MSIRGERLGYKMINGIQPVYEAHRVDTFVAWMDGVFTVLSSKHPDLEGVRDAFAHYASTLQGTKIFASLSNIKEQKYEE